jgi:hypothetical protein
MVPPPQQGPNRRGDRTVVFIVIGVIVLFCFGCLGTCFYPAMGYSSGPASTVPGPEDGSLRRALRGNLAFRTEDGFRVLSFPAEKTASIPVENDVLGAGGMDGKGRLWTIEYVSGGRALTWRTADGVVQRLATDKTGQEVKTLAVAPSGKSVAWIVDMEPTESGQTRGKIEVWDVEARRSRRYEVAAADEGLSWFPDGVRLAFVRNPRDPARVSVLDTRTGKVTRYAQGSEPLVAADGSGIFVHDGGRYFWVSKRDRVPREFDHPSISRIVAVLDADRLLAYASPTDGHPVAYQGQSDDGRDSWTQALKVFSMRSGRFVTLADGLSLEFEQVAYVPGSATASPENR